MAGGLAVRREYACSEGGERWREGAGGKADDGSKEGTKRGDGAEGSEGGAADGQFPFVRGVPP